jgi:deoxyxylulose-5-phosphate synthase
MSGQGTKMQKIQFQGNTSATSYFDALDISMQCTSSPCALFYPRAKAQGNSFSS